MKQHHHQYQYGPKSKSGSEVWVDLENICHNLDVIKKQIGEGTGIMGVVKADAYGHGIVEVARAIKEKVQWLAVNDIYEGIALREAGIGLPVLVFGVPDPESAQVYCDYDLTATVSRLSHFGILKKGTHYHLNFDTGMGRLGLAAGDIAQVKETMGRHPGIQCTGIYSHFATADDPASPMIQEQAELFRAIRKEFSPGLAAHISNTGGVFCYREGDWDLVRPGIGMYGYPPGDGDIPSLKPALEWKSYLTQVRPVRKGDTTSYGATWEAPEDGYVGVVPVGYEDGLRRSLSGKMSVIIDGNTYRQAGIITMNYFMVYLGSSDLPEGTEVTILDTGALTARNMARILQTISYEVLVSISSKTPRRYR